MAINRAHPLIQRIDKFLYSPAYFFFIGGLTILANVFCQELLAYTFLLLTGVCVCLFARDLLPLMPILPAAIFPRPWAIIPALTMIPSSL